MSFETILGQDQARGVLTSARRTQGIDSNMVRMASISEFEGEDLVNQRMYYDHGTVARQLA